MYRVIGTDRRYGCTQCYGEFKTLRSGLKHMNLLITAFGNIITFKCEEVDKK
jgi:hypothetical protein